MPKYRISGIISEFKITRTLRLQCFHLDFNKVQWHLIVRRIEGIKPSILNKIDKILKRRR